MYIDKEPARVNITWDMKIRKLILSYSYIKRYNWYMIVYEETWEHICVNWQKGKCHYQRIVSCSGWQPRILVSWPGTPMRRQQPFAAGQTFRPWSSVIKRIGTNRRAQHTAHSNEPIAARMFAAGMLIHGTGLLILLYLEDTWEHASVHWQQGKCQLWANCFICWMPTASQFLRYENKENNYEQFLYRDTIKIFMCIYVCM